MGLSFHKKIAIGALGMIILAVALWYRDYISQQLAWRAAPPYQTGVLPSRTPVPMPPTGEQPGAQPRQLAAYRGRDPEEVRPLPEEVKLFSDTKRAEIYTAIGNHGKTVKENPDYFFGWIQIGLLKKVIGDYEGARDAWEYAGLLRPENSLSFGNLGELYWRYLPDYPRSERNFKTAIANKPSDVGFYVSLSDLYFYSYKEKAELADDILLQGLAKNPESIDLVRHLAFLYERRGEYAFAITWWQKVLAKDPGNLELAATIEALKKKVSP
jgi:tetratricopeptide (TPR) repeat protein